MKESQIELRKFPLEQLSLIAQVDRTETVRARYVSVLSDDGLSLTLTLCDYDTPLEVGPWSQEGVQARVSSRSPRITTDGFILGAFDNDHLVGFVCLGPRLKDGSAELVALFVDKAWRRSGVGAVLLAQAEAWARTQNIIALFTESNDTSSSVGFYLKNGFTPITLQSNAIIGHRNCDPVLAKVLDT